MRQSYLVLEADGHSGHKQGLSPSKITVTNPDKAKDEEIPMELSGVQQRLLSIRTANIHRLKSLVKRKDWMYMHLGDQTNGGKYIDDAKELGSYKQTAIAYANMVPILEMKPSCVRVAMSTPSHAYGGDADLVLHNQYRMHYPGLDIRTGWHGLTNFKGYRVEHKHHGPKGGYREWTKTNSALLYLKSEAEYEMRQGRKPPDLYVRAHIHVNLMATYTYEWQGQWHETRLITVPSMCGVGCYARQTVINLKSVTNGMIVVEMRDGRFYDTYRWTDTQDLRYEEVIE